MHQLLMHQPRVYPSKIISHSSNSFVNMRLEACSFAKIDLHRKLFPVNFTKILEVLLKKPWIDAVQIYYINSWNIPFLHGVIKLMCYLNLSITYTYIVTIETSIIAKINNPIMFQMYLYKLKSFKIIWKAARFCNINFCKYH